MTFELMLWILGGIFVIGATIMAIEYKFLVATPIFVIGLIMFTGSLLGFVFSGIYYMLELSNKQTYEEFQSQCEDVNGQVVGTNIHNLNCVEWEVRDD